MTITAFTVLRNGNRLGYPWLESILSVLDRVNTFIISEGYSDDDTWEWIQRLKACYPKVKAVRERWHHSVTGFAIGDATNSCMDFCRITRPDWLWLVQSDELYHPDAAEYMARLMNPDEEAAPYDGIEVGFLHLQNNYQEVQAGAGYQTAIRAVRNRPWIRSFRDAWTFSGCRQVYQAELPKPVVHANRTYWHNIPLKLRSHADSLYPDLGHYRASAEEAEALHGSVGEVVPDAFTRKLSPFDDNLPDIIKPTVGWLKYEPREELLA